MNAVMTQLRGRPALFAAALSLVLLIANVITDPDFADPDNWPRQLATLAPLMLVALASTPSIVSGGGGIDLSVGPLAVLCNVILVHKLLPSSALDSPVPAIIILCLIGIAVGAINGLLITVLRYQPVIATLCMTFVITGLNLEWGSPPRSAGDNWTESLSDTVLGPVPGALLLMAAPILIWIALSRTSFHRNLYAVGSNEVTAYSSGIDIIRTRVVAYATGGLFAAFGGIALTALVQTSQANQTALYILVGLTAVALGGTPLMGGRGGLTGSFFGAFALYLMQTLLPALSVPSNWVNIIFGVMLIVGVVVGARATMAAPPEAGAPPGNGKAPAGTATGANA